MDNRIDRARALGQRLLDEKRTRQRSHDERERVGAVLLGIADYAEQWRNRAKFLERELEKYKPADTFTATLQVKSQIALKDEKHPEPGAVIRGIDG